jgi:hypothetical protein
MLRLISDVPRDARPLVAERGHRHVPAAVERTEQRAGRHAHVAEEQLAEADLAGHGAQRPHLDARAAEVDEQAADPPVRRGIWVGPHVELAPVGEVAEAVPGLLAVDDEAAPVGFGRGAQRGQVRPRVGLRHPLRPDLVAPQQRPQEPRLLLGRPVGHDRRRDVGDADRVDRPGCPGGRHLLVVGDLLVQAGVSATMLDRPGGCRPAGVGQLPVPRPERLQRFVGDRAPPRLDDLGRDVRLQPRPQPAAQLHPH